MDDTAPTHADYDAFPYPSTPKSRAAPEHLHAASLVYGLDSVDPATCSFLELGCFDGLNVLAFAAAHPRARCVGIDLSAAAIAKGRALAADAGLANVELIHGDIMQFPRAGESFDYISAHGVLTWVPEPVRGAVVEIMGARLSQRGVAYLGYDALPASANKAAICAFIMPLVAHIEDPERRVDAFVSVARALHDSQAEHSMLKPSLSFLITTVENSIGSKNYFFHDYMEPFYRPMAPDELIAMATPVGIELLGDAVLSERVRPEVSEEGMKLLLATDNSYFARSRSLAFLTGNRTFRSDMLCRPDAPRLEDDVATNKLRFAIDATRSVDAETGTVIYDANGPAKFRPDETDRIAILDYLLAVAPHEAGVVEVTEQTGVDRRVVADTLRAGASSGLLRLTASPEPFVYVPGERPLTTGLNRALIQNSSSAVSLRQESVQVGNDLSRMLLMLCDGTRTQAEIASALSVSSGQEIPVEAVSQNLTTMAYKRLLAA